MPIPSLLLRGGTLLGLSAIGAKFLALWRDRLLIDIFQDGQTIDLIFASFRIPDFFFFLLISSTVSTLLIPRITDLEPGQKQTQFFSSFLWGVAFFFSLICGIGVLGAKFIIPLVASGFTPELQNQMLPLTQLIFGSIFLLSLSSVFAAYLQFKHRFISISLAPVLYTGSMCLVLLGLRDTYGISTVGIAALTGATLHLLINCSTFFLTHGKIGFFWKKPLAAWHNFKNDFLARVLNSAAFQINQTLDIVIASFLLAGSVAAFSIGSNLGHVLLSIVGIAIANVAFPKLTQNKNNFCEQKKILCSSTKWILFFTIPTAIFGIFFGKEILQILFNLSDLSLEMTKTVFVWTVASLPAACLIPILARFFLANDDARTPLIINALSLGIATTLAAILALWVFPPQTAILGLALGNFTANYLSAGMFGLLVYRKLTMNN